MKSATSLTEDYIREHRSIKDCLKKGILNYSALARLIAKDENVEKKTSKEAILVAARRFRVKISGSMMEDDIIALFKKSNIEIKNNVFIYTLEKTQFPDALIEIERDIKKQKDLFFAIEGTRTITVILQKQHAETIEKKFRQSIIRKKEGLSLITITSPGINRTPGAVSYITGLFFEHGVNIEEFMSCHDDTLIVVESKDMQQIMEFLKF